MIGNALSLEVHVVQCLWSVFASQEILYQYCIGMGEIKMDQTWIWTRSLLISPTDLSSTDWQSNHPFLPLMIFAPKDQHPRFFPPEEVNLSVAEFGHGTKCNYRW